MAVACENDLEKGSSPSNGPKEAEPQLFCVCVESATLDQPWTWPAVQREEADNLLAGQPGGTFLIRKSSRQGDFTLMVRMNDENSCIRIYNRNGHFGLSHVNMKFTSLSELVEHYKKHSLASFNKHLDVCLRDSLLKKSNPSGSEQYAVFKELYDLCQEELSAHTRLSILANQRKELDKNVKMYQLMLPALRVVQQMYHEQNLLQEKVDPSANVGNGIDHEDRSESEARNSDLNEEDKEIEDFLVNRELSVQVADVKIVESKEERDIGRQLSAEEEKSLTANTHLMMTRLSALAEKCRNIQLCLEANRLQLRELDTEVKSVEGNIVQMEKQHEKLTRQLVALGCEREYLYLVLEPQAATQEFDSSFWLVSCSREEAVERLRGLPHGAFLVRPKEKRQFPYVLSIVVASNDDEVGTVQHCYIVHPRGRGYGFNASLAVFHSLDQLVLRHRYVSLKYYFKDLDVPLAFPVGCEDLLRHFSQPIISEQRVTDGHYANASVLKLGESEDSIEV